MPSPFPGTDPYLEGPLWPDAHQQMATDISRRLNQQIRPQYVARLAVQTVRDTIPPEEIGVFYPGVEIIRRQLREAPAALSGPMAVAEPATITPAITVPLVEVTMRMVTVELYTVEKQELVTCIEILSPANKRGEGLSQYLHKRRRLHRAGVHLLEIDLTRRGRRPMFVANEPEPEQFRQVPYLVSLWRAGVPALEVWPVRLTEKLPTVAVPLRAPDFDVPLDLGTILASIYDLAAYDLSIDYSQPPPPPPFDEETTAWMQELLTPYRQRANLRADV
ncbi:MAG: hypothetical protein DCC55_15270 [Chloroflexi bacterium]|nr:MAG: hypothetical protein DCC55_15270 [Chloroflexota bacterium]